MAVYKIKISVKQDQLHKINCENEVNAALKRKFMFGWLPEEYRLVNCMCQYCYFILLTYITVKERKN